MDIREIEQLVKLLEQSRISSMEIEEGDRRIKLEKHLPASRRFQESSAAYDGYATAAANDQDDQRASDSPLFAADTAPAGAALAAPRGKEVKSPMVGVFYEAPSPDEEPFAKVGAQVKKGDVLCIIEAMKLMNEITAESDGEIVEICVENGDVVEFGQTLFRIA